MTVKAIRPNLKNAESVTRPLHAFQSERTTAQHLSEIIKQNNERIVMSNEKLDDTQHFITETKLNELSNLRLQPFKFPDQVLGQLSVNNCLISRFSRDGQLLAFSSTVAGKYSIIIVSIPDMKVMHTLNAHTNTIYDLDWADLSTTGLFPKVLISSSSDRTCIHWTMVNENTVTLKVTYNFTDK